MNRKALVLAIALAISASPVFANPPHPNQHGEPNPVPTHCNSNNPGHGCPEGAGGHGRDDGYGSVCGNGNHTHNPHCEEAEPTATPRPHHENTPVPQPTAQPTATQQPPTSTPAPTTNTPMPTGTAIPTASPTVVVAEECIPCGEADAPTPVAIQASSVTEIAPAVAPQAMPVQVLSAGPTLLPFTGDAIPYVASLLLGFGLTIGGWLLRRGP